MRKKGNQASLSRLLGLVVPEVPKDPEGYLNPLEFAFRIKRPCVTGPLVSDGLRGTKYIQVPYIVKSDLSHTDRSSHAYAYGLLLHQSPLLIYQHTRTGDLRLVFHIMGARKSNHPLRN